MTKLPLRYVNEYRDVRGKVRRYFRRRGQKKVPLHGLPGSEELLLQRTTAPTIRLLELKRPSRL
jgi:hypothetical protein